MKNFTGDIDIDVADRSKVLAFIKHVPASNVDKNGKELAHNVGIYVQDIPSNPITGRATFEYKLAETLGYNKIDILNNSIYEDVDNEAHLNILCDVDRVQWELLDHEGFVEQMPHINGHFDIVSTICPRNLEELAIVLALIRPAKRYLLKEPMAVIKEEIWKAPSEGGYWYKKSHALSYSLSLVVKMNLMSERVI